MNTALLVISIILTVLSAYQAITLVVSVQRGAYYLKRARRNGDDFIRCNSTVYQLKNYIITIVFELLMTYIMYSLLVYTRQVSVFLFCMDLAIILNLVTRLIVHIIAIFREKYSYLTSEGLVIFIGRLGFTKCRFVWEAPEELSDTLHVYLPKKKQPFTVIFEEQIEEAHRMVDANRMI